MKHRIIKEWKVPRLTYETLCSGSLSDRKREISEKLAKAQFELWYEWTKGTSCYRHGMDEVGECLLYRRVESGELRFIARVKQIITQDNSFSGKREINTNYDSSLEAAVEKAVSRGKLPDEGFSYSARSIVESNESLAHDGINDNLEVRTYYGQRRR